MSGIYKGVGNQLIFTDSLRLIRSKHVNEFLTLLLYWYQKEKHGPCIPSVRFMDMEATCKLTIMIKKI